MHYTDGVRLATQEQWSEALANFEKALAVDPDHDPSLFEAANALISLGDTDGALSRSARAVELDPDNIWYKGQQARLLASVGRYNEALVLAEQLMGRGRDFDPDTYRMAAILYYQKGRTDDALAILDSIEVRTGGSGEVIDMKRGMLIDAGRTTEAAAITEVYVEANPYDRENRLALADIYAFLGVRPERREALLKEVVEMDPDNADALEALADIYLGTGRAKLGMATLRQLFSAPGVTLERKMRRLEALMRNEALYRAHFFETGELALLLVTRHGDSPEAVEMYADHAVRAGDPNGALAIMKTGLLRPSPALSTFMKTIQIEAWMERPDSVALWSDRALKVYPGEIQIYLLRSSAQQYLGRSKDALRTLTRALKVATTDSLRSEVHGAIGTLHHEAGDNKKTFASYERALAYNRDNALVLNNYAYFLSLEERELDRALGMAKRAVRLRENFATYLDTYAWVLYKTGDYAEARRVMQQALPLDRDGSAELLIHYGDILWALGENFMASVYWKRARDAGWQPAAEIEERLGRMDN